MIIRFKKSLRDRMQLVADTKSADELRLAVESATFIAFDLEKLRYDEAEFPKAA